MKIKHFYGKEEMYFIERLLMSRKCINEYYDTYRAGYYFKFLSNIHVVAVFETHGSSTYIMDIWLSKKRL